MNKSTYKNQIKIITNKNQKEIRIDKFLKNYIQNISRNQIQKWTTSGKILVNKNIVKKNYKIKPLDFVEIEISIPSVLDHLEYKNITAEKINLDILYEDEDVLVVNKPAGMVVHPGFGNETGTLIHGIKYHLTNSNLNNFNLYRCGLVHRLDKDTSGLLVFAKNEYSQKHLFQQFYSRTIQRKYIALIWGNLIEEKGTITGFIGRDPKNRKKMTILKQENQEFNKGKFSVTHYKVLERFKYLTYVSCNIKTGKTHQIRAHFKHLGHPLFHDSIYGGNRIFMKKKCSNQNIEFLNTCLKILQRQALHAISLSFIHPRNGKCHFLCPIPEDFKTVLENCRNMFLQ
ncbi:pseudouridylate synthase (ribosomal large subunit pseudouridine synthase D) [Blattabacterium sp. (Blattella germanica) str. Bge]|uniref:RluA family pseudouridine synthase n=1 Tax=Blattabacterium sp. (Blattella germanica) TaxID=624186 RepID=UPI0001BB60D1|nr:RluA family pseudouridine synthase [Blattabacterium sp. (Blattella germanica)]ACY40155.1 pseudouridylate synthase (ribosomal large subunit pseudouridine synthase D) [Blattabacterium sp. (Blattella germanica) str. Bge]